MECALVPHHLIFFARRAPYSDYQLFSNKRGREKTILFLNSVQRILLDKKAEMSMTSGHLKFT
jgi:hypothetical protein